MTPAQHELLHACARRQIGLRLGVVLVHGASRIQMARRMVKNGWLTEGRPDFSSGIYFEITTRGRLAMQTLDARRRVQPK